MSKKDMVEIVPSWDAAVNIARGVFENPKATNEGYQAAVDILRDVAKIADSLNNVADLDLTVNEFKKLYKNNKL